MTDVNMSDPLLIYRVIDEVNNYGRGNRFGLTGEAREVLTRLVQAHLATLSGEVELKKWVVLSPTGEELGTFTDEDQADAFIVDKGGIKVELTGIGKLPGPWCKP